MLLRCSLQIQGERNARRAEITAKIHATPCADPLDWPCTVIPTNAMLPEAAPTDASRSVSVCTVMPVALPAVAAPIVKPPRVILKVVIASMPTTAVVMMIELPFMVDVAVMVGTDVLPAALSAGFGVAAKNPTG